MDHRLFGTLKFYKRALSIAVPIMLQQLIQNLVSLIDNFMVSGLGDVSMSGVNVAGQILFVFMVYINTICISGGIFMTQYYGANDRRGMSQSFRFKLILGLSAIILYFLVCIVYPRQVLSLMLIRNTQADLILDEAVSYINIMFFMGAPMTLSVCIATSLRDLGQVRIPLVVTIVATITNTLFNYLLIYGNMGFPRLGVRGAAIATVIARVLELTIFIVIYLKLSPPFIIHIKDALNTDWRLFGRILKKASLVLFCEMVWVLSETVTTALYNGRGGADVVSGMASSFAIANLFFVAFTGIYASTGVIIGKNLGEGRLDKARTEKNWILSGAFMLGLIMTAFGLLLSLMIPIIFGKLSNNAVEICRQMVIFMSFFMPVWVYMDAQQAVARAGGDTAMGACTDSVITIFIVIPMIFFIAIYTDFGPVLMFICVRSLDLLKIIVFHFWLKKERWLKNLAVV